MQPGIGDMMDWIEFRTDAVGRLEGIVRINDLLRGNCGMSVFMSLVVVPQ